VNRLNLSSLQTTFDLKDNTSNDDKSVDVFYVKQLTTTEPQVILLLLGNILIAFFGKNY